MTRQFGQPTYTVATLTVSPQTYSEIMNALRNAGYEHVFKDDGLIDMSGIGLNVRRPTYVGQNYTKFEKRIMYIVAEQLGMGDDEITRDTRLIADLGADSLDTVELIMACEDEFGIEISDEEVAHVVTVQDIIELRCLQQFK